jgi:hypothetical protein
LAECDTRITNGTLWDSASTINAHVRQVIARARAQFGTNAVQITDYVFSECGWGIGWGTVRVGSEIEGWLHRLGPPYVHAITRNSSKYRNVTYNLWSAPEPTEWKVLDSTMLVGNTRIGSDKLGHFFQQGFMYYENIVRKSATLQMALDWGHSTEAGGFGLATTGVYSRADLEANYQGYLFYRNLHNNPAMNFDISDYINSKWNEESHTSTYVADIKETIWQNLLEERPWRGDIADPTNPATRIPVRVHFRVLQSSPTMVLSGIVEPNSAPNTAIVVLTGNMIFVPWNDPRNGYIGFRMDFSWTHRNGTTGTGTLTNLPNNLAQGPLLPGASWYDGASENTFVGFWGTGNTHNLGSLRLQSL